MKKYKIARAVFKYHNYNEYTTGIHIGDYFYYYGIRQHSSYMSTIPLKIKINELLKLSESAQMSYDKLLSNAPDLAKFIDEDLFKLKIELL